MEEDELEKKILSLTPRIFQENIKGCISFAKKEYTNMKRYDGSPMITHGLNVGISILETGMDINTAIAGILHEIPEIKINDIEQNFPKEIVDILNSTYNIRMATKSTDTNQEIIIKYILNSSKDLRPVILKVFDKLDDIRTIENIPEEYKKEALNKALNIYSVLAEYLFLDTTKKNIEEKAFQHYLPIEYESITKKMEEYHIDENLLNTYKKKIEECTTELPEETVLHYRVKSKYSIYNKLKKYEKEWINPNINSLDDLIAFRIITDTSESCFKALEKLMDNGEIVEERYDDYISNPKPNGYKAIQFPIKFTEISDINIEIQIVTHEMYYNNKYGPASHIAYKASQARYAKPTNKYNWVKEVQDQIEQNKKYRDTVKDLPVRCNIFEDEVFVFTPKQKIVPLNNGDTVLDFAYRLHSSIGKSAVSAKVNNKPARLGSVLKTGDIVEIKVDKNKNCQKENVLQYANSTHTKYKIIKDLNKSLKK